MANLATNFFESITIGSLPNPLPCVSNKAKGCGYYGQTNGMHTVQYSTTGEFIGVIQIQGTLATDPTEADWYTIRNTDFGDGVNPMSDQPIIVSFSGNHVWVRAIITAFTAGAINRVLYTHN